jgi:hypothetical protein
MTENHTDAVQAHQAALDIYRSLGDQLGQARALRRLGSSAIGAGNSEEGLSLLRDALVFFEKASASEASQVRTEIAEADDQPKKRTEPNGDQ